MAKAPPRDLGQSALSAFRADRPTGGRESTPADDDVHLVATLLRHATMAPGSPASRRMIRRATRIAKAVLGRRRLAQPNQGDTPNSKSPLDVFRMLAERCHSNGQLHLEDHLLASVERLAPPHSVTYGRVVFRRSIRLSDMGAQEAAQLTIDSLLEHRRWSRIPELVLRGWTARSGLAYQRGNMPEARRFALRVVRAAGNGHPDLKGIAYTALGVIAAEKGDFNTGIEASWKAYDLLRGRPGVHRDATLSNIAQVLLDAGYPAAARAAFARMLGEPLDARVAYPAIGGYALASAALGNRDAVEWATAEVLRLAKRRGYPDVLANALFECSEALAIIGEQTRAGTLRRRSARLAEQQGFHHVSFKAQRTTRTAVPPTTRLTKSAAAIVLRITEMEPASVPAMLLHVD